MRREFPNKPDKDIAFTTMYRWLVKDARQYDTGRRSGVSALPSAQRARQSPCPCDTLAEAIEHVEAYRQLTAPQATADVQTASPSGSVHGFMISSPRMR